MTKRPYPVKPITIADLVTHLQTFEQTLPVCYRLFSEQCLLGLDERDVAVVECCEPRPDGWVEDKRPDKPSVKYLKIG